MKDSHKRFADEYLVNGMNATQAYLVAYPNASERTAGENGFKLLKNAEISDYIKQKQEETSINLNVSKERLIQDLIDIVNDNKKIRPGAATKAIEVINKMQGYNAVEKQEIKLQGDVQWIENKNYKKED